MRGGFTEPTLFETFPLFEKAVRFTEYGQFALPMEFPAAKERGAACASFCMSYPTGPQKRG